MPETMEFARYYLAAFFSVVAAFYTFRVIYIKHKIKNEVVFPGKRYCSTWFNHMTFRFFRALIFSVCVLRALFPSIDQYLGFIAWLQNSTIVALGIIMLTVSFAVVAAMHIKMDTRWRSGIDVEGPQKIMRDGLYQYTRHPMFLFVGVAQLGFFFAMPSIFTLICLIIGWWALSRQASAEEKHLLQLFPTQYSEYSLQVRKWI
jgi:protein-S-isoprenylcysteine O-methyltransferase Ste14